MTYDVKKGKVIIPASGIKIEKSDDDDDYYDDDENADVSSDKSPHYKGAKVLYMSFTKRVAKNLHYVV